MNENSASATTLPTTHYRRYIPSTDRHRKFKFMDWVDETNSVVKWLAFLSLIIYLCGITSNHKSQFLSENIRSSPLHFKVWSLAVPWIRVTPRLPITLHCIGTENQLVRQLLNTTTFDFLVIGLSFTTVTFADQPATLAVAGSPRYFPFSDRVTS